MGALDAERDRPGHPHGAGAPERVRQCGHRRVAAEILARMVDPRPGRARHGHGSATAVTPLDLDQRGH